VSLRRAIDAMRIARLRGWLVALATTLVAAALAAPAAQAAFSMSMTSAAPSNLQAGAHSNVVVNMTFTSANPGESLRDLDLDLPAGLLGNPNAVNALCSQSQFNNDNCPSASKVGEVDTVAHAKGRSGLALLFDADVDVGGNVYLLQPTGGEPARMGIILKAEGIAALGAVTPIKLQAPVTLRAPGDYGLTSVIRGIPNTASSALLGTLDIYVKSMKMTLYGTPPTNPKGPFLTNPTECVPATFLARATAHNNATAQANRSFTPTGCTGGSSVPFEPTFDVAPKTQRADQPTNLSVTIGFPGDAGGRAQSHLKSAVVTLPVGTALSPGVGANGLDACADAQFAAAAATPPACPARSKIGTVSFNTPLLGVLNGDVYLGAPTAANPFRLLVYATLGAVRVKLTGVVSPDPQTGQLTATFSDLPRVPFTSFTLSFRGGDDAVLKAPPGCGTYAASARLEPYARPGTFVTRQATFNTNNCTTAPFAPSFAAGVDRALAGGDTHLSLTVARGDEQPLLDRMVVRMPPGLLGRMAAIPSCPLELARSGLCGPDSRVGTVTVQAGTGGAPATLTGTIHLTPGFDGGIAGLAVVVPARVGPIDLGHVVVINKMVIRPEVGVDVVSEPLPRIVGGVPLALRSMTLSLDRDGFLINASSCAPQAITAALVSVTGEQAEGSAPYEPTGCDRLPFEPQVTAAVGDPVTAPSLTVTIEGRPGHATMAGTRLTLPAQVGANLQALNRTCLHDDWVAGNCPARARIGSAEAVSPLIPVPLSGPVTLVQVPGRTLPSLAIDLSGPVNVRLRADNDPAGGRLRSTVAGIPDVPLSRFTLKLDGGGLLKSDLRMLCTGTPRLDAVFTSHSGAQAQVRTTPSMPCKAEAKATATLTGAAKGRKPSLRVRVTGKRLKSVRVALPRQLRPAGIKALRRHARVLQGGRKLSLRTKAGKRALRRTGSSITVSATRKHTGSIDLRLRGGALRRGKGLKVGRKLTLKVTVRDADGRARTLSVRVRARR